MRRFIGLVAICTFVLVACGGDDDSGDEGTGTDDSVLTNEDGLIVLPFADWQAEVNTVCQERFDSFLKRDEFPDVNTYFALMFTSIVQLNEAIALVPPPDANTEVVEEWFAVHQEQNALIETGLPELESQAGDTEVARQALDDFQALAPENERLTDELGVQECQAPTQGPLAEDPDVATDAG